MRSRSHTNTGTYSQIWLLHIKLCKTFNPKCEQCKSVSQIVLRAISNAVHKFNHLMGLLEMDMLIHNHIEFPLPKYYHIAFSWCIWCKWVKLLESRALTEGMSIIGYNLYKNGLINGKEQVTFNSKFEQIHHDEIRFDELNAIRSRNVMHWISIWLRNFQSIGNLLQLHFILDLDNKILCFFPPNVINLINISVSAATKSHALHYQLNIW